MRNKDVTSKEKTVVWFRGYIYVNWLNFLLPSIRRGAGPPATRKCPAVATTSWSQACCLFACRWAAQKRVLESSRPVKHLLQVCLQQSIISDTEIDWHFFWHSFFRKRRLWPAARTTPTLTPTTAATSWSTTITTVKWKTFSPLTR